MKQINTPKEILETIKSIDFSSSNPGRSKNYTRIRDSDGYIKQEHRIVWERHNGKIPKGFVIHHINGNGKDNRIENLQRMTFNEHMALHKKLRKEKKNE